LAALSETLTDTSWELQMVEQSVTQKELLSVTSMD
jgi:hypothetical protein